MDNIFVCVWFEDESSGHHERQAGSLEQSGWFVLIAL